MQTRHFIALFPFTKWIYIQPWNLNAKEIKPKKDVYQVKLKNFVNHLLIEKAIT